MPGAGMRNETTSTQCRSLPAFLSPHQTLPQGHQFFLISPFLINPFQNPSVTPQCLHRHWKPSPRPPPPLSGLNLALCPSTHSPAKHSLALFPAPPTLVPSFSAMARGTWCLLFVDRERVPCVLLCQCVCTLVRLCFMMSAAVCQWICEIKYMCVPVQWPWGGQGTVGVLAPQTTLGPCSPPPHTPILPFSGRQSTAGLGQGMRSESQLSPCHLAPGRCEVPARRAWAPGPRQVHKLTLPPPAAPLGAGPVAAPPLAGRGPPGGGPLPAPPSSRSGPPRAVIG